MGSLLNRWWARKELNLPPAGYEPAALPLSYGPTYRPKRITFDYTFSLSYKTTLTPGEEAAARAQRQQRRKEQNRKYDQRRRQRPEYREYIQEYHHHYQKERLRKAKEGGSCLNCKNPAIPGQTRCKTCADKHRARRTRKSITVRTSDEEAAVKERAKQARRKYDRKRSKTPERKAYLNTYNKAWIQNRKSIGLCRVCSSPAIPNQTRCEPCAENRRISRRKADKATKEREKAQRAGNPTN